MAHEGIVLSWSTDEEGKSKGYGFIERLMDGARIFCHKSQILDGDCLKAGSSVRFDVVVNERRPSEFRANGVVGGLCFLFFKGQCNRGRKCRYSHITPSTVRMSEAELQQLVSHITRGRSPSDAPMLVDCVEECRRQCEQLGKEPVVAVDLEGVNLGRGGEVLLLQLALPSPPVVIVDIAKLGQEAFELGGLRELLESQKVMKLVYDGRADADALLHHFGCKLSNVYDCQVLFMRHLHVSDMDTKHLAGLGRAIASCPTAAVGGQADAVTKLKKEAGKLFNPSSGGSYEVWRDRPIHPALLEYAATDVLVLHDLKSEWGHLISDEKVREITEARLQVFINGDGRKGQHMAERDFSF
ncbi:MAG: hypothetical protein SGPRY_001211 [Prymnesium sp.]